MIMDYHRGNREIHGTEPSINSIESIASEVLRHVQEDQAKGSKKGVRVNMRCYGRVTRLPRNTKKLCQEKTVEKKISREDATTKKEDGSLARKLRFHVSNFQAAKRIFERSRAYETLVCIRLCRAPCAKLSRVMMR